MTVILAVRCSEGLLVASDSQATAQMQGGYPVRMQSRKLSLLGKNILFGSTGAQGVTQRVTTALEAQATKMGINRTQRQIVDVIQQTANPIQQAARQAWVQLPNSQPDVWAASSAGGRAMARSSSRLTRAVVRSSKTRSRPQAAGIH